MRIDAVAQRAVVQHRHVEAGTVPRHEHGREAIEAVEEALHDLLLRGFLVAEAEDREPVATAQHARDRDYALLRRRQEVAAADLPLLREHHLGDGRVVQILEIVQAPAELDVRHRFDVENEGVHRDS